MSNLTFQITPDSNKDSETIQMGRDLKLSCHVDATPQDKVNYTWYKNGAPVFNSDSLILLRSDPDMAPGTSSLEIVDMKFRDLATYSCVANFPGSRVPELRVDVNISQNSGEVFLFLFISHLCQTKTTFHDFWIVSQLDWNSKLALSKAKILFESLNCNRSLQMNMLFIPTPTCYLKF